MASKKRYKPMYKSGDKVQIHFTTEPYGYEKTSGVYYNPEMSVLEGSIVTICGFYSNGDLPRYNVKENGWSYAEAWLIPVGGEIDYGDDTTVDCEELM